MNIEEYERTGWHRYAEFAEAVASILKAAITARGGMRPQDIQRRAKDAESLRRKLARNGRERSDAIEDDVKDLAGARIVFYTNNDVHRFGQALILSDNFDVDYEKSKIHYPTGSGEDEPFFISENWVVRLKAERTALPEYAHFAGMRCEIQIQTTLDHAWAEMAHDTVYKPMNEGGFGTAAVEAMRRRLKEVMRTHLLPAGYEFQKIASDYMQLKAGRSIFDADALTAIRDCTDRNNLKDTIQRFFNHVLPNYDDVRAVATDIIDTLVDAAVRAPGMPDVPYEYGPGRTYPGVTPELSIKTACDVLGSRYLVYVDPERIFDGLVRMYRAAHNDRQRKPVEELAERFSRHDREAWRHGGHFVQDLITSRIAELDDATLAECAQLATLMMRKTLSSTLSSETFDGDSFIFHSGSVLPGNALGRVRRRAIEQLKRIHRLNPGTNGGDAALSAMAEAGSTPNHSGYTDDLGVMIMSDLAEVVRYYGEILPEVDLERRRRLEIRLFQLYYHFHRVPNEMGGNAELVEVQKELLAAMDQCRQTLEENEDYRRYRTLVGHDNVTPLMWQTASYACDGAERSVLTATLANSVHPADAGEWLVRLERYVLFESNDLATFMELQEFIRLVAVAQPAAVLGWIDGASRRLSSWLPAMLHGLVEGGSGDRVDQIVCARIEAGSRLSELAWYLQHAKRFDIDILAALLRKAIETDDDEAVATAVFAAVRQFSTHPDGLVEKVFLPAVRQLNAKGDRRWLGGRLFTWRDQKILEGISETEAIELLNAMNDLPRLGSHGEELLGGIAIRHPGPALDFIGWRFTNRTANVGLDYEAMPYDIHYLKDVLATSPDQLLRAARIWYAAKADLFKHFGGRIVAVTFPVFGHPVENILKAALSEGDWGSIAFVLAVLSAYEGELVLHPILRDIVDILGAGDKLLKEVHNIIQATGALWGEHGSVDALKERQEAMGEWKADCRPKVQAFADDFIRGTANSIAWETRRADQSQAQRRLQRGG